MNAIHASDGSEMAARELAFFFPKYDVPWFPEPPIQRTLALIRPQALKDHKGSHIGHINAQHYYLFTGR